MSSTRMDVSPNMINRKLDITAWPEGDVSQLDKPARKLYHKRQSALKAFFETDLSVDEISSRYHLASTDCLEVLARSCLSLHPDGRPWGFRALVPGADLLPSSGKEEDARPSFVSYEEHGASQDQLSASDSRAQKSTSQAIEDGPGDDATLSLPAVKKSSSSALASADLSGDAHDSAVNGTETTDDTSVIASSTVSNGLYASEEQKPALDESLDMPASTETSLAPSDIELPASSEPEVEPVVSVSSPASTESQAEAEQTIAPSEVHSDDAEETLIGSKAQAAPAQADEVPVAIGSEQLDAAIEAPSTSNESIGELPSADPVEETITDGTAERLPDEQETAASSEHSAGEQENNLPTAVEEQTLVTEQASLPEVEAPLPGSNVEETLAEETLPAQQLPVAAEEGHPAEVEAESTSPSLMERQPGSTDDAEPVLPVLAEEARAEEQVEKDGPQEASPDFADEATLATLPAVTPSTQLVEMDTSETSEGELRRNSRQLSQALSLASPTQSSASESRYRLTGKPAIIKQAIRRRWVRQVQQKAHRRWVAILSAAIIVTLLVILLIPVGVGLAGYSAYSNIKGIANDGVSHLMAIKSLMPASSSDLLSVVNQKDFDKKLTQANSDMLDARSDFLQLQDILNRQDVNNLLHQFAPEYSGQVSQMRSLVHVALDVTYMGQELIGVAQMGTHLLHGGSSLLASSNTPLVTADNINQIEASLVHTQYYIGDIQTQMKQVNLATLPLGSASQKAQISKYLKDIPMAQDEITQVQGMLAPVTWLLGVDQPRHFLVQTLDRGELRASGGFEGQYGILNIQNGRMGNFSLKDITLLDYAENGAELGTSSPPGYEWMNFGNFGVRDANLSADYPTTAQIVMRYFQQEGGGPVDGDIQITPVVIEQFLDLTGPIQVPDYNETITSQNLEVKLHAYQQQQDLINKQEQVTGQTDKSTRKAFTNEVGSLIMDRAKHMQMAQLMPFSKVLLQDLKSRDLQIYFTNPQAEQWLVKNGYSGAMPDLSSNDGFMVVQSNVSISKAAQYVHSTYHDQVTLDNSGGATHDLTITLDYQQTGPVYGYNTYADYLRVYAPPNAQFHSAYGFNTGATLCTPTLAKSTPPPTTTPPGTGNGTGTGNGNGTGNGTGSSNNGSGSYTDIDGRVVYGCGSYYHNYPDTNARSCPDGNYQLGIDGMQAKPWAVQALGGPSSSNSDLPGYQMWGGMTLTPKNCTSTITLEWYVPNVAKNTPGQPPYQEIVGHQAGWPVTANVDVDAGALSVANFSYQQTITVDTLVALPKRPK